MVLESAMASTFIRLKSSVEMSPRTFSSGMTSVSGSSHPARASYGFTRSRTATVV